jgi:hypothetical protein
LGVTERLSVYDVLAWDSHVVALAGFKLSRLETIANGIFGRGIVGTTDAIKRVLAVSSRFASRAVGIANLDAEHHATHEIGPLDHLCRPSTI